MMNFAPILLLAAFVPGLVAAAEAAPQISGSGPVMLAAPPDPAEQMSFRLEKFQAQLDAAARRPEFVGFAVAVVNHGEIELVRTYGVRDAETKAPVTPHTVFRIGSLSKAFASSLAALAIADDELALGDKVTTFVPAFRLKGGREGSVTVESILSHRVGLPPNAYDNLLEAGDSVESILPRYRSVAPICAVGACYAYQNVAFNMIADILAQKSGEPYEALVKERLLDPIGMSDASVGMNGFLSAPDRSKSYTRKRIPGEAEKFTAWAAEPVKDTYYRVPAAGGVNASITDMAKWLAAAMGDRPDVLPSAALDEIFTPRVETPSETRRWTMLGDRLQGSQYALGWRVYEYSGHTVINHSGSVEGFGATIAFLPEEDVGIVILANTRSKRHARLLPAFLDAALNLDDRDWLHFAEDDDFSPSPSAGQ